MERMNIGVRHLIAVFMGVYSDPELHFLAGMLFPTSLLGLRPILALILTKSSYVYINPVEEGNWDLGRIFLNLSWDTSASMVGHTFEIT